MGAALCVEMDMKIELFWLFKKLFRNMPSQYYEQNMISSYCGLQLDRTRNIHSKTTFIFFLDS